MASVTTDSNGDAITTMQAMRPMTPKKMFAVDVVLV